MGREWRRASLYSITAEVKRYLVQRMGDVDVFEDGGGNWWGVFLRVQVKRVWKHVVNLSNTGRETFLVKADWVRD
jgi:hypothetical protein